MALYRPIVSPPKEIHVSTITATARLGYRIDLNNVFKSIQIQSDDNSSSMYIIYVEYNGDKRGVVPERASTKSSKKLNKVPKTKNKAYKCSLFDHQMTIVICNPSDGSRVNAKVFINGHVQMTGLKTVETGQGVIDMLREHVCITSSIVENHDTSINDDLIIHDTLLKVHLINCDFKVGFIIDRNKLYDKLTTCYDVYALFEPCVYPGIKIQFFYNPVFKAQNSIGVCMCSTKCGHRSQVQRCFKSTIMVFQSGSVIISGSRSMDQVYAAHAFILALVTRHRPEIDPNFVHTIKQSHTGPNPAQILSS